jgi:hypothetical protein
MNRALGMLGSFVLAVALLALGFVAFTGYVAYSGKHAFKLPDAFDSPPGGDAPRLGGVLESGLSYAMRVCGIVATLLGACLALRRGTLEQLLGCVVLVLAGTVLITQHWAAGLALGIVAVALVVGLVLRRARPDQTAERGERGRA